MMMKLGHLCRRSGMNCCAWHRRSPAWTGRLTASLPQRATFQQIPGRRLPDRAGLGLPFRPRLPARNPPAPTLPKQQQQQQQGRPNKMTSSTNSCEWPTVLLRGGGRGVWFLSCDYIS